MRHLAFWLLPLLLFAVEIKPIATIEVSGLVSDMAEENGYLYVATDNGSVDIVDLATQKIVRQIHFAPILRSDGGYTPARIHAIDRYKGKTLMVTSAPNAYRNVWVERNGTLSKVIDASRNLMPKHAFFDKAGKILLGGFGSEVTRYDTSDSFVHYSRQVSESTLGGMALDAKREVAVMADESGSVAVMEINSSKVLQRLDREHVDNIYRVAYANGTLVTAGQDRRVGVYLPDGSSYHIKSDFLVYAVAISPSGKTALYSSGTEHTLQLFDTRTGKKGHQLTGHHATPGKILFVTEKAVISSGDEKVVYFWKLP